MAPEQRHGKSDRRSNSHGGRLGAAVVLLAPLVLFASIAAHPFIEVLGDADAVGAAVHANLDTWGIVHFGTAVGGALLVLAFLAVRAYLRDAGEDTWTARAIPLLVLGGAFFTMLPAMELGVLAGAQAGADAAEVQRAVDAWFMPVLLVQGALTLFGSIFLALGVTRSGAVGTGVGRFVAGALVVAAVARFIPLGVALYIVGIVTLLAFWPLGFAMWRSGDDARAEHAWRMAAG